MTSSSHTYLKRPYNDHNDMTKYESIRKKTHLTSENDNENIITPIRKKVDSD
jgi:hypothetical protein